MNREKLTGNGPLSGNPRLLYILKTLGITLKEFDQLPLLTKADLMKQAKREMDLLNMVEVAPFYEELWPEWT